MKIEYGTRVIDSQDKVVGEVDFVIRNSWSGEISKFVVRDKSPLDGYIVTTEDVLEETDHGIKLKVSSDKLDASYKV